MATKAVNKCHIKQRIIGIKAQLTNEYSLLKKMKLMKKAGISAFNVIIISAFLFKSVLLRDHDEVS